ncbi:hypothetical protein GJ496_004650 [Pomphorhynchus laevis]|nr:hypothetical protein GJ496_004650 [Pomphorhynchus laevis]
MIINENINEKSWFYKIVCVDETNAWQYFKALCQNSLGNHRSPENEAIVKSLNKNFQTLGVRIAIKLHFLKSHFDYFPNNCGYYSDEQGTIFHQDIKYNEARFLEIWDINILTGHCWCLKGDSLK